MFRMLLALTLLAVAAVTTQAQTARFLYKVPGGRCPEVGKPLHLATAVAHHRLLFGSYATVYG
jgi:hypothetical protein